MEETNGVAVPISMEEKIHACRRNLIVDPINKSCFERRYRPNLDSLRSSYLEFPDASAAVVRHFQLGSFSWELVEFLIGGKTDCVLLIDHQTQKILEYSRYVDAEIALVDQIQDTPLGGRI